MPLLDHFHPPLFSERHWEAFHARWAVAIADALNSTLPEDYFAETQTHAGSPVEIDVATYDGRGGSRDREESGGGAAVMASPLLYTPAAPQFSMPAVFPDQFEVRIISRQAGPMLVAAVELVSPGNKDRDESRRAFASKCASYLHQGVGLMVVDIVTNRRPNLHNEMIDLLAMGLRFHLPADELYAIAYRPRGEDDTGGGQGKIDVWHQGVSVGHPLPELPLPLDRGLFMPVDLEATYSEARRHTRLGR